MFVNSERSRRLRTWNALHLGSLVLILAACARSPSPASPPGPDASESGVAVVPTEPSAEVSRSELELRPLTTDVWIHVSFKDLPGVGPFPSNGLVIRGTDGAVLVDSAWGVPATTQLLDQAESQFGRVAGVIVTHWHDDRTGGLVEVHRRGIPSYGLQATIDQARSHGVEAPQNALKEQQAFGLGGVEAEVFYPGPGHTSDNLVVWLPSERLLFGGCLVRALDGTTLGNIADADVPNWSRSVARLQVAFPSVRMVVPGHGEPGGPELLRHTRELAEAKAPAR